MTSRNAFSAVVLLVLAAVPLAAQQATFDRSTPPTLPPPPSLSLPEVETATLPNGLRLYVIPMHEVPVVQFELSVEGGGRLDANRPGLASFTADMLSEGAGGKDAATIAAQVAFLGARLSSGAGWDATSISLETPVKSLDPALDLMADVVLRPTFAAEEVVRQRDLRLARILQQQDQPTVMASLAFNALVYPKDHPYHHSLGGDSASTAGLDSAMVRQFYERTMDPARARLVVAGDVTMDQVRREIGRRFGSWKGKAPSAPPATGSKPPVPATVVYLVDKPGAAQSVIAIGRPGVDRSSPDYYALEVMNTLLGGSFSSRLNSNLRETKGYTYGAGSGFAYRPLPGPFLARASVRTNVTDSSLVEFFKEFERIRDEPVSQTELDRARNYIALGLPGDFETTGQMANQINNLLTFGLPFSYYDDYVRNIMAVTAADVQRVARKYVTPDSLSVVVVGDLKAIRPGIEALKLGPITVRDLYGNPVTP